MICISDIVYKQSASVSKKIYFIQRKTWPHSSNFLLSIPIIQASANKVLFFWKRHPRWTKNESH